METQAGWTDLSYRLLRGFLQSMRLNDYNVSYLRYVGHLHLEHVPPSLEVLVSKDYRISTFYVSLSVTPPSRITSDLVTN